jgi:nitrilase
VNGSGARGNDLLVFPEVFIPGFPYWINCYAPLVQGGLNRRYQQAALEATGPELAQISDASRQARVAVALGFCERETGGQTLYNSIAFIENDGRVLGIRRKLQPTYAERYIWGRGDASTLFVLDSEAGRIGGLACWEHTMNLARQALVEQGQQIHAACWPSLSTMAGFETIANRQIEAMMRNHALTGQCFVVCASSPVGDDVLRILSDELGPQEFLTAGGGWSAVIHPFTADLAGPHEGPEEKLLEAEVDLGDLGDVKLWLDGAGHYARPELLWMTMDDAPKKGLYRTSDRSSAVEDQGTSRSAGGTR